MVGVARPLVSSRSSGPPVRGLAPLQEAGDYSTDLPLNRRTNFGRVDTDPAIPPSVALIRQGHVHRRASCEIGDPCG